MVEITTSNPGQSVVLQRQWNRVYAVETRVKSGRWHVLSVWTGKPVANEQMRRDRAKWPDEKFRVTPFDSTVNSNA